MPKTKPIIAGIICRPPDQSYFLEIINENFWKLGTDPKESCIIGGFNINMYQNNKYIVRDDNTIFSKFLSSEIKNHHPFCTLHGFKQLIKSPCNISTLVDYIPASFPSKVSQKDKTDV